MFPWKFSPYCSVLIFLALFPLQNMHCSLGTPGITSSIPSDPVYTVPDEFGTGLKFVLFRLFTREFVLLGGLKFVQFCGSCVFTRPKGTNFRPVPNSSGTV